jgi:A predicted alpha-helical domain with a conserved ER motif./Transglutaminase-like superfamily
MMPRQYVMWRELNKLYLQLADPELVDRGRESPHELNQAAEFGSHTFQGVTDATLTHGEGWQFDQLGKFLERAEKTLRVLDERYHLLQGLNDPAALPLSALQWAAVPRSCRAYEAYQRLYVGRVEPDRVVEFLPLHPEFSRSVRFSLEAARRALSAIAGTMPSRELGRADRLLGWTLADLRYGEVGQILKGDVHAFLGGLLERCGEASPPCRTSTRSADRPAAGGFPRVSERQDPRSATRDAVRVLRAGARGAYRTAHGAGQRRRSELPLLLPGGHPGDGGVPPPGGLRQPGAPLQPAGPQRELRILSASVVETHPRPRDLASSRSAFPPAPDDHPLEVLDFVRLGGPVRPKPRLAPLLDALRPRIGERVADLVVRVAGHLHAHFEYARDVTLASSPTDDVLREGKGVCQDFTHLMIALLRFYGVPARYVSGYLHRDAESQSHAWCEACRTWAGSAWARPTTAWRATTSCGRRWAATSRTCHRTGGASGGGRGSRSSSGWRRSRWSGCLRCRGRSSCRR